jgi:hypothetical protein
MEHPTTVFVVIACELHTEAGSTATCAFLSSNPTQLALLGPLEASRLASKMVVLYLRVRVHDLCETSPL